MAIETPSPLINANDLQKREQQNCFDFLSGRLYRLLPLLSWPSGEATKPPLKNKLPPPLCSILYTALHQQQAAEKSSVCHHHSPQSPQWSILQWFPFQVFWNMAWFMGVQKAFRYLDALRGRGKEEKNRLAMDAPEPCQGHLFLFLLNANIMGKDKSTWNHLPSICSPASGWCASLHYYEIKRLRVFHFVPYFLWFKNDQLYKWDPECRCVPYLEPIINDGSELENDWLKPAGVTCFHPRSCY